LVFSAFVIHRRTITDDTRRRRGAPAGSGSSTPMAQNVMRIRGKAILASIPMGRLATPAEITDTVAFPCGDAATCITGQAIHVNGGSYM
jgi:NAD(P)-dependent dehydrogenase (short-subunit alcohol dehydrogenase family)